MNEFRFASPWWLLLIAPLWVGTLWSIRHERRAALLYSSALLLKDLPITWAQRLKRLLPWLRFLGMALLIVGLARPQLGLSEFRIRSEGVAMMMCLDRSGSMMALDLEVDQQRVDRLAAVKHVFRDFVSGRRDLPGRPDDLIGLIAFGGFAEAKSPLTLDHGALLQILETIDVARPLYDAQGNVINERLLQEERATAIGDAVALAVDRLKDADAKSKVIILLSDGENTAGVVDPQEAALAARQFGIKIYTIGVGTTGRAPFRMEDEFGRPVYVQRVVRLDEETLAKLAETTQGHYFRAQDTTTLEQVYAEIDELEKTPTEGRLYTDYRELFPWLVLPGLGVVLAHVTLRATRFRSLP